MGGPAHPCLRVTARCHLQSHGRHQRTEALSSSLSQVAASADPLSLPPPQPEPRINAASQQSGCHPLSLPPRPSQEKFGEVGEGRVREEGVGREDREGRRGGGRRGEVTPAPAASKGGNPEVHISPRLRILELQPRAVPKGSRLSLPLSALISRASLPQVWIILYKTTYSLPMNLRWPSCLPSHLKMSSVWLMCFMRVNTCQRTLTNCPSQKDLHQVQGCMLIHSSQKLEQNVLELRAIKYLPNAKPWSGSGLTPV